MGHKAQIGVARAFIANPQVLIWHRPFHLFTGKRGSAENKLALVRAFKEHRDNRGLCAPPETRQERRPRTIIFTAEGNQRVAEDLGDIVWYMPENAGGEWRSEDRNHK